MAFDGTDLYYTIRTNTNIFRIDVAGNCLGAVPVSQAQGAIAGGPLAWDGSALWTMNHLSETSFTLFRINPADGSILSSCNIATQNPGHPAVTDPDDPIGFLPDGLDWTGSTLWVSSSVAVANNWVVEVDTNCNILAAFQPAPNTVVGTSGVAFDGFNLWHNYWFANLLVQTDVTGTSTGLSFPDAIPSEFTHADLACDGVTFQVAVLWANLQVPFGPNQITAYEIPQCQKVVTRLPMLGPAALGGLTSLVMGSAALLLSRRRRLLWSFPLPEPPREAPPERR